MHSNKTTLALFDIRDNGKYAKDFVAGLSLDDFKTDRMRFYAVTRAIEMVSEAARRLPPDCMLAIPNCHGAPSWGSGMSIATTTITLPRNLSGASCTKAFPSCLQHMDSYGARHHILVYATSVV
jgi:hypothetical protein